MKTKVHRLNTFYYTRKQLCSSTDITRVVRLLIVCDFEMSCGENVHDSEVSAQSLKAFKTKKVQLLKRIRITYTFTIQRVETETELFNLS